jgi:hypothetical protein
MHQCLSNGELLDGTQFKSLKRLAMLWFSGYFIYLKRLY